MSMLFTIHNLLLFVGGMMFERGFCWARDKYWDHKYPSGAPHKTTWRSLVIAWALVISVFSYMAVQTEQTRDMTLAQAAQVAKCQKMMTEALDARDTLRQQQEQLTLDWQDATSKWINILANPPADIAALHTTDPIYQAWAMSVTHEYTDQLSQIDQRRVQNNEEMKKHPLPSTSCSDR